MSIFAPGTGGTVKSTTWEALAIETSLLLQNAEEAQNALLTNPINRVAVNYETGDPKVATVQINMPITLDIDTDGGGKFVAAPFLNPAFPFTAGAGSDLKSTNLEAAVLEGFYKLQALEKTPPAVGDPIPPNNVNVAINTETLTAAITATLPISFAVGADGRPVISATTYL